MAGIEARPISKEFVPLPAEMASKFRLLRDREAALRAENANAKSEQKASVLSGNTEGETLPVAVPPPVVMPPEPVDNPVKNRPGRQRNPITSIKQLRIVAAKAIKDGLAQPDLTLAKLKAKLDLVWNSLDADNFEGGEPMETFNRFVWDRLRDKAKEQGFPLDGLDWHDQSGFVILAGDHGENDPDDDPPKGGPSTQASDGEASDSTPIDTKSENPPERGLDKAIQTIDQLSAPPATRPNSTDVPANTDKTGTDSEAQRLLDLPLNQAGGDDDQYMTLEQQHRLGQRIGRRMSPEAITYRQIAFGMIGRIRQLSTVPEEVVAFLEKQVSNKFWGGLGYSATPRMILEAATALMAAKAEPPKTAEQQIANAEERMTEWRKKKGIL